jgi:tetratricopeptide (TPR) repeat protein
MVGEGDSLGARIPLRDDRGALLGYKTDASGLTVRTWRRDAVLRAVVDAAGGVLVPAETADQAGAVHRVLTNLERTATREQRREDLTPRAWLFALGALALLTLQGVLRKGPALALLALAVIPDRGSAQRPSAGDRLLRLGDTSAAAAAYVRDAALRPTADTALFNAGTAALARGQFDAARKWLGDAARSLDPGLRFRALYNLGLVALIESRRDTTKRATLQDEAAQRFRDALLLAPASRETKWNLELVQSRTPPPSGGGGGGAAPPTPQKAGAPPPQPSSGGALSQAEAEQILNSVERTERDVRAEQARRKRVAQSSAGKDW